MQCQTACSKVAKLQQNSCFLACLCVLCVAIFLCECCTQLHICLFSDSISINMYSEEGVVMSYYGLGYGQGKDSDCDYGQELVLDYG